MEVVLLEDVKALGKKGQIVKVSDGYGRNFILTKKLGIEATPKNLNDLKLQKANEAKIAAEHLAVVGGRGAALAPRSDVVGMHLGKLEVLTTVWADALLALVGSALHALVERADGKAAFLVSSESPTTSNRDSCFPAIGEPE